MLVDSGSSTSFVNQELARHLEGVQLLPRACKVKVADGGELLCLSVVQQCTWYTQGCEFRTDMKILALGTYDAILGMDWLEQHNPMKVDWRAKQLELTTATGTAYLRGHPADSSTCHVINNIQLQGLCKKNAASHIVHICAVTVEEEQQEPIPTAIQHVLSEFSDVFGEPVGLPPRRACDHRIPLIPGAQPVNIRPYRHKSDHKDEIERQVAELLKTGVIQHSISPFASPAILVKKKDGTWRLCIDYRHLNSLTCISKYPVPVIEELLDELHGASDSPNWIYGQAIIRSGWLKAKSIKQPSKPTAATSSFLWCHLDLQALRLRSWEP